MSETKIRYDGSKEFKNILSALNTIADIVTFDLTPEKLSVLQMDASHISMVQLDWFKESFDEWNVTEPKRFALDLDDLLTTVFKRVGRDEFVTLELKDEKAIFTLSEKYQRVVTVNLCEPDAENPPTPKLTFNTHIKITSKELLDIMKDAEQYGDHITITATHDVVQFEHETEHGFFKVPIDRQSDLLLQLDVKESSKAIYSLSYLKTYIQALQKLCDIIEIEYSTDMPIKLTAQLNYCNISFYVAPRIEANY